MVGADGVGMSVSFFISFFSQGVDMTDNSQTENTLTNKENLSLFGYYVKCWKNFRNFGGRSRRKEFWSYQLFNLLIFIVLAFVCGLTIELSSEDINGLFYLYSFITVLPNWAVFCRRMHDIGRSGFWCLIGIIPLIGCIILIVMCCKDSQPDKNEYGDCPKKSF